MDKELQEKLLPFEIDTVSDEIIAQSHGITPEEMEELFTEFVTEQNNQIKLSEMEVGKKLTIAAVRRSYETNKGPKDLILFVHMVNIGQPNNDEYNQIKATLLKLEIVEVGEISDNYLDFMNRINETKK